MAQVEKLRKASDSGSCFNDEDFDIEANKELTKAVKTFRLKDRSGSASFIDEGSDACDVKQGQLGDCWFLAALSSIAAKDQSGTKVAKIKEDSVKRVLQTGFNSTMLAKGAGGYHFKFFRMGEWVDVVIDDKLPDRHEGKINRAIESKKGEWWVPLVEKAYAKFHGGYNNIVGGETAVALTELSGGIAVDANNLDSTGVNIGDLLKKLQRNSLITTSNRDGAGNETVTKGLVSGHAYSLLLVDTMTLKDGSKLDMVKIRNPQGRGEWDGAWNDDDTEWAEYVS